MDSPVFDKKLTPNDNYYAKDSLRGQGHFGPGPKNDDDTRIFNNSSEGTNASVPNKKRRKTVWDVLGTFAGVTSLQGVPYIQKANRWWSTVFWTIAFIAALGFMAFHSYYLINLYLEDEVTTVITLGYDDLDFPSVTICNMNPFVKNKIEDTSPEMQEFLEKINPVPERQTNSTFTDNNQTTQQQPPHRGFGNPKPNNPQRRFTASDTESSRQSNLNDFLELYGQIPRLTRREIGQRADVFIQECSFNGYDCTFRDFSNHLSPLYGNCWTFNSAEDENASTPLVSYLPGKDYGLNLRLYIEGDQYIPGVAEDVGVVVAIHDHNTMSFPEQNGISVASGMTTLIGLKLINITRLEGRSTPCKTGAQFNDDDILYTREACLATCTHVHIKDACHCYLTPYEYYYPKSVLNQFQPCGENTTDCVINIQEQISNGVLQCTHCISACNEKSYDTLISASRWPAESIYGSIVDRACEINERHCSELRRNMAEEIPKNFVNLKIYYRELNFEDIQEQEAYPLVQFVSDVGGVLGLWVGISVLSIIELIQLGFELVNFGCKKHCCGKHPEAIKT